MEVRIITENIQGWETRRQKLIKMLTNESRTLDLKLILRELDYLNKKVLIGDIESITKTLKSKGIKVIVEPSYCIACGYIFNDNYKNFKIPSKCPKCNQQRIEWPLIKIKNKIKENKKEMK